MLVETGRRSAVEHAVSPLEKTLRDIQDVLSHYQSRGFDARLIGSFGRQASLHTQNPTARTRSDIDVLFVGTLENTSGVISEAQQIAEHDVFTGFFCKENGKVFMKYRDISVAVDPRVLQLRIGSLAGRPVHTLDPNLLFHLSALFLPMRPKDKINLMQHARKMMEKGDFLPEEMFEPFHTLMDLKRKKYPIDTIFGNLQYFYLKHSPEPILRALFPVTKGVKRIYTQCLRNPTA